MEEAFSSRDFREALSGFATGVTIVTTSDERGEPVGVTASSFNSVSMDPPLILWSVAKTALSASAFKAAGFFAIHVLACDQVALSNRFARSGEDKFGASEFSIDENSVPILSSTVSRFDCSTWAVYEGGDHWIIIGKVENIERGNAEPLVFCGGSYAIASPLRPTSDMEKSSQDKESPIDGLLIYNLSRAYYQVSEQFHYAVRESGLTLSEWRILASLYGGATRDLPELAARTFVDPKALRDMVSSMQEDGLCIINGPSHGMKVSGTDAGHSRVKHLFALGAEQEKDALGDEHATALPELISVLKNIISNTNLR